MTGFLYGKPTLELFRKKTDVIHNTALKGTRQAGESPRSDGRLSMEIVDGKAIRGEKSCTIEIFSV